MFKAALGSSELFTPSSHSEPRSLSLTVLFTTVPATLYALKKGAYLAHQLGAKIRILVPSEVSYALEIERPRVDPLFRLRRFRTMCEQQPIETSIDVRLCRDARQCVQEAISPHSLILIGCRKTWWPLSSEARLAKRLKKAGHEVILVKQDDSQSGLPQKRF